MRPTMCDVCWANRVLEAGPKGLKVVWDDAPKGAAPLYVRARGTKAEFQPATFQTRVGRAPRPRVWKRTEDLASAMGGLGLDVRWAYVPASTKARLFPPGGERGEKRKHEGGKGPPPEDPRSRSGPP